MSQPSQLETSVKRNHRYSFIATPLEMHPPQFPRDPLSPPPLPTEPHPSAHPSVSEQFVPLKRQPMDHKGEQQQPIRYEPSEKERRLQEEDIIPTFSRYPPPEQHPAYSAPFANSSPIAQSPHCPSHVMRSPQYVQRVQSMQCVSPSHSAQYAPQSAPSLQHAYTMPSMTSPESSYAKQDHQVVQRCNTFSIEPDSNPLQSPTVSYQHTRAPAATSITTPAPPHIDDLGAFHQPGQIMHPDQEVQGGTWTHGLCDCSGIGTCCMGLVCPCILYGKTQHRLSMKSRKEDPTNMLGYDTCNGSCTAMGLLCGCQWLLATIQRTRTRKAYGIHGNVASDCLRGTCCTCCTLIQDEKEILKREEKRDRAARERGTVLLSQYTTPGKMTFAPPPK